MSSRIASGLPTIRELSDEQRVYRSNKHSLSLGDGGELGVAFQFLFIDLVAQSTIRFSAEGDMVSSMSLYSLGPPVTASWSK